MANLLVEIGNTAVKAAWAEGTTLGKTFRYQGEKVMEFIVCLTEEVKPEVLAIVSSYPLDEYNVSALNQRCSTLLVLDSAHPSQLLRYSLPECLPYDRACSVIAAAHLFKDKSCSIFDFGTTMTADFISSDGSYCGGIISPGVLTRFKSLNRYSKTLPLVDIPERISLECKTVEAAMETGVISGIMFEIEGYLRLHPENIAIFTGGDANYFAKRMKNSIFVVCNLVLLGLALITDSYVRKNA